MNKADENIFIYHRDNYQCQRCGKRGNQIAHRIHQGKESESMVMAYWWNNFWKDITRSQAKKILDHPLNRVLACSLSCNDSFNCAGRPTEVERILNLIAKDIGDYREKK